MLSQPNPRAVVRRRTAAAGLAVITVALIAALVGRDPPSRPTEASTGTFAPRTAVATSRAGQQTPSATNSKKPGIAATPSSSPAPGVALVAEQTSLDAKAVTASGENVQLATTVRYPVSVSGGRSNSDGPYPLIVFSQGFDILPEAYAALLDAWTTAGFVVAAPAYPATSPGSALNEADILNHPNELSSVISAVLAAGTERTSPLHGMVDPQRIGVVGHSDGGDVALAVAANTCCRDPRIDAAVILSGAELATFGGDYYRVGAVPMLVVQGSADTVNPPANSIALYNAAPVPKYYLNLIGADHRGPYLTGSGTAVIVVKVTIDFLVGYLDDRPSRLDQTLTDGTVAGVSTITNAPRIS